MIWIPSSIERLGDPDRLGKYFRKTFLIWVEFHVLVRANKRTSTSPVICHLHIDPRLFSNLSLSICVHVVSFHGYHLMYELPILFPHCGQCRFPASFKPVKFIPLDASASMVSILARRPIAGALGRIMCGGLVLKRQPHSLLRGHIHGIPF
jgi:hypothetical protein